jgi:alpha,alpha-trehalase
MVAWVLCRALEVLEMLPPPRRAALADRIGLSEAEIERWEDVSRRTFVPISADGIISQFEGYEELEELDWDVYRERYGDIHRLDRILEAEGDTPNRYKASKQADVLMLFYLLSAERLAELFERLGYPFERETIPRNVEYYSRRTSHGSTLSRIVHSWVLARSDRRRSWELFREALESDVADVQGGTTSEGIHLGAMAGTVDLVQRGYAGVEARGGVLWFDPSLPAEVACLQFSMRYRGHWGIEVRIADGQLRVSLPPSDADPVTIGHRGRTFKLAAGERYEGPA